MRWLKSKEAPNIYRADKEWNLKIWDFFESAVGVT